MKKIGIMSMQRVVNYGSFMQSYALKNMIQSIDKDFDVEFVDFNIGSPLVKDKLKYCKKIKRNKNLINFLKKRKVNKLFAHKYDLYLKKIGVTSKKNYNPSDIDTLVIGSDEVFNCMQDLPIGYSKELFGYHYFDKNVISYAASFGNTTLDQLKKYNVDSEIGEMLSNFKSISVRDSNSYHIVKTLCKKNISLNLDPVLIWDFSNIKDVQIKLKNYIILYVYPGRLSRKEEAAIKRFAKNHDKKIITLGMYQRIADDNTPLDDPFSIFSYFKNADYVITDTFHGSIFSIKSHTKFCSIIRDSNSNKLNDLLITLKQNDRIANNVDYIEKLYNTDCDFMKSDNVIKTEREKAIKYLSTNLK